MKKAVGLKYDKEEKDAPTLVTKGQGLLAEKIIEKAKELDIFIKEDEDLVELLYKLEVSEEIPEELYEVVAEVFIYLYELENKE